VKTGGERLVIWFQAWRCRMLAHGDETNPCVLSMISTLTMLKKLKGRKGSNKMTTIMRLINLNSIPANFHYLQIA
jgi:hypothetical protein